jgi:integrase
MPVRKLDAVFVQHATCPTGRKKETFWDTEQRGLILECQISGKATFAMRWTDENGVQRQHRIGRRGEITLAQARKIAQRLRSEITLGQNPAAQRERRKAVPLYAKVAQQQVAEAKTYQRSWWSVEGILRRHILPRFGNRRLDDIKPQEIARWLGELSATYKPATVEKIRAVLHRSFELAKRWNVPGGESNPVHGLPRQRYSNARQRYLTADEIQRLRLACENSSNPQLKHIVGLLLLTGARKGELLNAKWEHVDLERRLWFIPQTKNGRSRHVPLSAPAMAIIQQLPRVCEYLVPNLKTCRPFVSIKWTWDKARVEAGLRDVRCHDLRHASASLLAAAGVDLFTIGRLLGHTDYKSTQRYAHLANDRLFEAVEAGANKQAGWTALKF